MATAGARGPAPSAIGASKGVWPARLAAARGRRRWKGAHEGGHHTIISPTSVFRSKLGSKLGSRPEPRAKVAPTARVAREVVHRLSEPTLHVVHPVASRLRLHRHAEEPIVLRLGARVERGSVAAPRHRESDDVRRDGGRLPAQQAELQHRVGSRVARQLRVARSRRQGHQLRKFRSYKSLKLLFIEESKKN